MKDRNTAHELPAHQVSNNKRVTSSHIESLRIVNEHSQKKNFWDAVLDVVILAYLVRGCCVGFHRNKSLCFNVLPARIFLLPM